VVPVVDLSRRGHRFADEFVLRVRRIAESGQFLLGDELEAFEEEFAGATGGVVAVGVASGAAALQLALLSAGVRPGDDVVVPAFTAVPTASAVAAIGARPVLCDVDAATACATAAAVLAARTPQTTAAIIVHLYGYPVGDATFAELSAHGITVIEDAAQATGALRQPGRSAATAYSFYPTKNLGGIGDGGAIVTDDVQLADSARRRRVHGMTEQYVHDVVSQNFRMSELEAAWLRLGLQELEQDNADRRRIALACRAAAPHLGWQRADDDHVFHLNVFRAAGRDAVRQRLAAAGVATSVQYPLAITQQPAYRFLDSMPCPASEAWAAECISVPCFPEMTDAELEVVCAALASLDA
jgi:dTDP-4-amino-4,6-dideoxygalactose transaminase